MLELKNIKKSYYKRMVLQVPFLQLDPDIYWVKGANGSGKTTFLKMIAGLIPFEGDIYFKNVSLKKQSVSYRQNIGWAEAEPLYPSFMTGEDLLYLYKRIRGAAQKDIDSLIDLYSMGEYISEPIGTYSTGMIKKLSLSLAFIGKPSLIVLDEPLITLDNESLDTTCHFINELHQKNAVSFLLTSHQSASTGLLTGKELIVVNQSVVANELHS